MYYNIPDFVFIVCITIYLTLCLTLFEGIVTIQYYNECYMLVLVQNK